MSWSRITGGNNLGTDFVSGSSVGKVFGGAVAVGDLIIVDVACTTATDDGNTYTCADTLGNTYTRGGKGYSINGGPGTLVWFYSFVTVAGTPTVTVTFPNGKTNRTIAGEAYRSSVGVPSFDQSSTIAAETDILGAGPDNVLTSSITPSVNNCLVVAGFGQFSNLNAFTAGTGFTIDQNTGVATVSYLTLESLFQSTAAAKAGLGTDAGSVGRYLGFVASFKESSVTLDDCLPDADVTTTGWSTAPLFSKVNDASDATVIQATAV